MARRSAISDGKFKQAYRRCKTVVELAANVGMSTPNAYYRMRRLNLPLYGRPRSDRAQRAFDLFKGTATYRDVAIELQCTPANVRALLETAIVQRCYQRTTKLGLFAPPRRPSEIKILHELERNERLFNDPAKLAALTDLSERAVNDYLEYAFNLLTSAKPSRKSRS